MTLVFKVMTLYSVSDFFKFLLTFSLCLTVPYTGKFI